MPFYKNFRQVFDELKQVAIDNNLSIEDLVDGTDADPQLLRILFDENTDVVDSISRMFEYMSIKLFTKQLIFKPYHVTVSDSQIKVRRLIHPKCHIYFNRANGKFYDFQYHLKRKKGSETRTEIIKTEMQSLVNQAITQSLSGNYKNNTKTT